VSIGSLRFTILRGVPGLAIRFATVVFGLLIPVAIFSVLPFATQDGPAHVTFGNFLALDSDTHPLLFQHYRLNDTLNPNAAVYVLIRALVQASSPAVAESVVQVLCTLGVVASAWFALRQVSAASDATWLTLMAFPLSLSRLFFFGTYNFCLSVAGFLLVVGSFLRLQKRVTFWRAVTVVAALYFAFFAHAGGFVAAGLAVAALAFTQALGSLLGRKDWRLTLRAQRTNLLVLASPLPLIVLALRSSRGSPVAYGIPLSDRLRDLALLEALRVHSGPGKELATLLLNPILFGGAAALGVSLWLSRRHLSHDQRMDSVGALALFGSTVLLALTFPDNLGGGWIHFQRMALFPYFGALFCLAYCPIPKKVRVVIASVAVVVTAALLTDAVSAQREIARQMRPLAEVNRIVGSHCSVLPLVLSLKPLDDQERPVGVGYNPYLHVGTRLEFSRDRVSLFNYQARTELYPVRFQERHDTQELIFHWPARRRALGIRTVDIERFETSSGMSVDYILRWGPLSAAEPELRNEVLKAERDADLVYESTDGRVALFRRSARVRSQCAAG
jgi:hypothetical protein